MQDAGSRWLATTLEEPRQLDPSIIQHADCFGVGGCYKLLSCLKFARLTMARDRQIALSGVSF